MLVLLVRHGSAGSRKTWDGDDRARPLDERGRYQARELAPLLASHGVARLLSSPYDRCVQTLGPAAEALCLPIEGRDELAEGASRAAVLALLQRLDGPAAVCTHGDVIGELLGPDEVKQKGSVWELDLEAGQVRPRRYVAPA